MKGKAIIYSFLSLGSLLFLRCDILNPAASAPVYDYCHYLPLALNNHWQYNITETRYSNGLQNSFSDTLYGTSDITVTSGPITTFYPNGGYSQNVYPTIQYWVVTRDELMPLAYYPPNQYYTADPPTLHGNWIKNLCYQDGACYRLANNRLRLLVWDNMNIGEQTDGSLYFSKSLTMYSKIDAVEVPAGVFENVLVLGGEGGGYIDHTAGYESWDEEYYEYYAYDVGLIKSELIYQYSYYNYGSGYEFTIHSIVELNNYQLY